jgi:hypothetical protein
MNTIVSNYLKYEYDYSTLFIFMNNIHTGRRALANEHRVRARGAAPGENLRVHKDKCILSKAIICNFSRDGEGTVNSSPLLKGGHVGPIPPSLRLGGLAAPSGTLPTPTSTIQTGSPRYLHF